MKNPNLLGKFLKWRLRNLSQNQFVLILSVIVGFTVGVAAVIIKNSVHFIQLLLTKDFVKEYENYLYFAYPGIGILIAILFIRYFVRHNVRHGIPSVLYAISKNNGIIKRHYMFSSIVTSALTVGFGGSVGLEGPTVITGASIGSNIGKLFRLEYKQITLLLGCACAGAIAAIFKAPIAAIVFAIEVIMLDLTMSSMIPLLLASATAALTSFAFLGQNVLYPLEVKETFQLNNFPYYILLGFLTGIVTVYFAKLYLFINKVFDRMNSWIARLIIGSTILGVLIFLFPSLYGEGYEVINLCLNGKYTYLFENSLYFNYSNNFIIVLVLLFAVVIVKVIATSVTFGAGGIGGLFAPSLFLGSNTGLLFALFANYFGAGLPLSNFALAGMGGTIAGINHAPLTAIFLIAEITGGYGLIVPLMITSAIAYTTSKIFQKNSLNNIMLAKRGELITHHKDKAVLTLLKMERIIETDIKTITPEKTLGDLVKVISCSNRNIYAVIDENNSLIGIVLLDHIRHLMFDHELYNSVLVSDLMITPPNVVNVGDSMENIMKMFEESAAWNLPVVKGDEYIGFVSKSKIFSAYRKMLIRFSDE